MNLQWGIHAITVTLGDMELRKIQRINPVAKAMAQSRRRASVMPNKKKEDRDARLHGDRILEQWDTESKGSQTQED